MKKILSLLLMGAFAYSSFAQKVDLDPFNFTFEYRNLPHTVFDKNLKTYSCIVDAPGNIARAMSKEAIESKIILQGLEKKSKEGDIRIAVRFDDLIIQSNKITESSSESKNKDGTTTKTYSYTMVLEYTMGGSAEFNNDNGEPLKEGIKLFNSGKYTWSSSSYKTSREAQNYYDNNRSAIINNLSNEKINEAIRTLNNHINYNMGFPPEKDNLFLWLVDNKKHPEHDAMNEKWIAIKSIIQGVTANSITKSERDQIMDFIKYFDELKTKYTKDEKGDKKIRYAAYFNNATLYLLLDQPEKAMAEAEGLITNDYDAKDGKHLKERAEDLAVLFKKNDLYKRHFEPDGKPYGEKW